MKQDKTYKVLVLLIFILGAFIIGTLAYPLLKPIKPETEKAVKAEVVIEEAYQLGSIDEAAELTTTAQEQECDLEPEGEHIEVLAYSSAKTYEDYRMITLRSSVQWSMLHEQNIFTYRDDGFIVTSDGFYAVALGSYYDGLGSKYVFITDKGYEIPVIITDLKKDKHTDKNHFLGINGDVLEFIVDSEKMPKASNGLAYQGNFNNVAWLEGTVVDIIKVED